MTPFAATLPTAQFLLELRQKHHPTPERRAALEADLAQAPGRRTRPVAVIDTNVLLDLILRAYVWVVRPPILVNESLLTNTERAPGNRVAKYRARPQAARRYAA